MGFNWLAAAVTGLFAFFIVKGYRKGFLKIAVSLAGTLAVMAGAMIISPAISSSLINSSRIYDDIEKKLIESFNRKVEESAQTGKTGNYKKEGTGIIITGKEKADQNYTISEDGYSESGITAEELNLPEIIMDDIITKYGTQLRNELAATVFEKYIAGYITKLVIRSSTFIIVSAVLSVGMWMILKTTDLISRIPVIKGFNRTLGCITGALEALIIVWIAFFIIIMCLGNSFGIRMLGYIRDSSFLTFLFNSNILLNLIR